MNRRSFLRLIAGAAPVAVVAPKYFFAPVGGWTSDVIVHPETACGAYLTADVIRWFEEKMHLLMVSNPSGPSWVKDHFVHPKQREAIEALVPMLLWGLQYEQTMPPYTADTYLGISREATWIT